MLEQPKELEKKVQRSWVEFFSRCCCCCFFKVSRNSIINSPITSSSNTPVNTPFDSKRNTPTGTPRLDALGGDYDSKLQQVAIELSLIAAAQSPEELKLIDTTEGEAEIIYSIDDNGDETPYETVDRVPIPGVTRVMV